MNTLAPTGMAAERLRKANLIDVAERAAKRAGARLADCLSVGGKETPGHVSVWAALSHAGAPPDMVAGLVGWPVEAIRRALKMDRPAAPKTKATAKTTATRGPRRPSAAFYPQTVQDVLAGRARYALLCADGFALARDLGDGAVDLVIGDLPYDDDTHAGARTNKKGSDGVIDIDFPPLPPVESFAPALLRCSRRWTICCCAVEQLGEYARATGEAYIRGGLWVRTNGTPQKTGDRPAQGAEGIAIMHRAGRKRWNGHGRAAVWTGPRCDDPTRKHPTKKPLWLMEALLRDFADPGDVVLDPTCGEGTTGEACLRLGLRFIGCEIDPKYHAMAVARLARAASFGVQMTLPTRPVKAKQEVMF